MHRLLTMANSTPPATVKSAMRTLDIIELVVAHGQGIVAQDIARSLAIPVSSLSYLLATLAEREYLHREGRLYFPGPGLDRLRRPRAQANLVEQARPLVRALRLSVGETASYFVRDKWEIIAAATENSDHNLRYSISVGSRTPLHCVAAGKAVLAALDEAELATYFAEESLAPFTPFTLTGECALRAEITAIRETGIATTNSEFTPGIRGLGVAVCANGGVVGAFGIAIPESRFDAKLAERAADALRHARTMLIQDDRGEAP